MGTEEYILMTGGAGFIGSHTIIELLERDINVLVLDNMTNSVGREKDDEMPPVFLRIKSIVGPEKYQRLVFVKGSYDDEELVGSLFKKYKVSCVMHLGGYKAVGESKKSPMKYYSNNVAGTVKLVQVMRKHGVTKMIFSSSATVYTELGADNLPLNEKSPTGNCSCAYANSKYFIENMMKDLCDADKSWTVMSLRYFNPVGAHPSGIIGEDPKGIPRNLMPYIAQVAVNRLPHLNVFGGDYPTKDGTPVRDYMHVVDLAKGHTAALDALPQKQGFIVYNLGNGVGTTVLEILKQFGDVIGRELPYKICDRRPGDASEVFCDPSLAAKELNWRTTKTLADMCRDMWVFQSKNPNGYAN